MYFAIRTEQVRVIVWLIWFIAVVVFWITPWLSHFEAERNNRLPLVAGVVICDDRQQRGLFPWQATKRWRKWAWQHSQRLRQAHRRAVWAARLSQLVLSGAMSLATVVDGLTTAQLQRHLGALPVLYALFEVLQVRAIINRHCPTAAEIDHGTVVLVLALNRLMAPRPLYKIADWLGQTVLVQQLAVPAEKFNDDRLGRTLDTISQQGQAIWQDIVDQALRRTNIDLSLIFYDLSAYIAHGDAKRADSTLVDFGFAHNTPMNKQKFKTGLDVSADGDLPLLYQAWAGRTADKATVIENMTRLVKLLQRHGWPVQETMLIGDRANLDDALALAYDDHHLRYLSGLPATKKVHRDLLLAQPTSHFYAYPLTNGPKTEQCWGIACPVMFEHEGRQVTHQGVVILSQPMTTAIRKSRAVQLRALRQDLTDLRAKIGQPRYRTLKSLQRSVNARLNATTVGHLLRVEIYINEHNQLDLRWQIDTYHLWQAMQPDGRYLLVTNDLSLSSRQMLTLYRSKDGVEKRFRVTKSDLQVSPMYVHLDSRLEGLLLVNMIALLAYSLLERQMRQSGLNLTTRRLIEKLDNLHLIETYYLDGSGGRRLSPIAPEQLALFETLADLLTDLALLKWIQSALPDAETQARPGPEPGLALPLMV
jgi:transposase